MSTSSPHFYEVPLFESSWLGTRVVLSQASYIEESDSFELMAEAQRDITPEQAASRLRACPEVHYLDS
jgi:UDPglucose--hexose-1-phosphate uridylyltransferase